MSKTAPKYPAPDARQPILTATRNLKMAESAHAYVRGSTVRFYEWLEGDNHSAIPEGPPVWICGDCHVGNLGPIGSADGTIEMQIRDLDQTVVGNPAHDLIRLGLSLAMAARGSDLPGVTTAQMLERMVQGYESAFDPKTAEPDAKVSETVRVALRQAAGRSWEHLADERIEGRKLAIPLGKRFWPLAKEEQEAMRALFEQEEVRALVASLRARDDDADIKLIDAAYWRKGCSSLGRLRYAALLEVKGQHAKQVRYCLMDVKEAIAAAAPRHADARVPRDNAERVVAGAQALSPHLGDRMLATRLLGRGVFMRELLPQDLKLEIEQLTRAEAMNVADYLAQVVGLAHARQMSTAQRKEWQAELAGSRTKTLDAPSWLWASIVDLVASHEAAYLEHCRRYAMETARAA